MIPEISVALVISGQSVTVDLIDKFRVLGATKCWLQGDTKQGTALTYTHNGCSFTKKPEDSYHVHEVSITFLKQLMEIGGIFQVLQEYKLSPTLSVGVYASDVVPSINLNAECIQLLAEHNISIDIDVILISSNGGKKERWIRRQRGVKGS